MGWDDIALVTFSCVTANHLGLISALEGVIRHKMPIMNCPKCLTFWMVLFMTSFSGWDMVDSLAVSFLSSYLSLWMELSMGFIDTLYNRFYEKIYTNRDDDEDSADGCKTDAGSTLSDVQEN